MNVGSTYHPTIKTAEYYMMPTAVKDSLILKLISERKYESIVSKPAH